MLLKIKDLNVSYDSIRALRDMSLEVNEGELVTLIGHNGAGKTTLLKTISGIMVPDSGSIEFEGKPIQGMSLDKVVRVGISHSPEGRQVFPDSTVKENIEIGAYIRKDKAGIEQDVQKYYEMFPVLGERRNQKAGTLSGGEQQMLAIARALMSRPKLLLLDEPSLGLAPVVVNEVYRTIQRVKQEGMTILLVEQNAKKALNISDRAYVIANGQIVMSGDAAQMINDERVKKAYLGG